MRATALLLVLLSATAGLTAAVNNSLAPHRIDVPLSGGVLTHNGNGAGWFAQLSIGAQNYTLLVDTGSVDCLVATPACKGCDKGTPFDAKTLGALVWPAPCNSSDDTSLTQLSLKCDVKKCVHANAEKQCGFNDEYAGGESAQGGVGLADANEVEVVNNDLPPLHTPAAHSASSVAAPAADSVVVVGGITTYAGKLYGLGDTRVSGIMGLGTADASQFGVDSVPLQMAAARCVGRSQPRTIAVQLHVLD